MNTSNNILYVIIFVLMMVVSFLLLLASNFEKLFKQGKITEIRIAYVIASIIISYLVTSAFITLVERIHNIF